MRPLPLGTSRVRDLLRSRRLDALVLFSLDQIRYFSGFRGSAGILLLKRGRGVFLTDGRYGEQARREVRDARIVVYRERVRELAREIRRAGARRVGVDAAAVSFQEARALARALRGSARLVPLDARATAFRMVKSPEEIRRLQGAARMNARGIEGVRPLFRPGRDEAFLAQALEVELRRAGSGKLPFDLIIASGPHAALPHAHPGRRRIRKGDLVVVDFGARCGDYSSDETITWSVGPPSLRARKIHDEVRRAHDLAVEGVRPGMRAREVDRLARASLDRAGLARYFTHSLGHGIGLLVHEPPWISERSEDLLEEGMAFTIEPGVYIPGWGGVRIEDTLVLRRDGAEVLTRCPKGLERFS